MTAPAPSLQTETALTRSVWAIDLQDARLEVVAFTAKGVNRRGQGDAFLVNTKLGLLAIADGVSSLPNGGLTARRCLKGVNQALTTATPYDAAEIRHAIETVNRQIFAASIAKESTQPLGGCILVGAALWPRGDGLTYYHVGDGALVHRRGATASFEAVTQPQVSRRRSARDPNREVNRLTAAIGARPTISPDLGECELGSGSAFVLLSDGMSNPEALTAADWFNGDADLDRFEAHVRSLTENASDDMTIIAARLA